MKIVGCDCGKNSLYVCIIEEMPRDFKRFSRSYKPKVLKASKESIDWLLEQNADCYVLEPTGSYSYIWIDQLKKNNKEVRLVSPRRVTAFRVYQGVTNKQDKPDAAAIACYSFLNFHSSTAFIGLEQLKIRELYFSLKNTINNRSPIENRLGQRLTYECPELVKTFEGCVRLWLEPPPMIVRYLAGEPEAKTGSYSKQREKKVKESIGRGISRHSKLLAQQIRDTYNNELELERELDQLLQEDRFNKYNNVFDQFLMKPKTRIALLCAMYPFESFLENGREIIEYIASDRSSKKTSKRNRSEGAFKLSLGMGLVIQESGKKRGWVKGGPKYARTAIWGYVTTMIVMHAGLKSSKAIQPDIDILIKNLGKSDVRHWLNDELIAAIAQLTEAPKELVSLRLHYAYARENEVSFKRRTATGSRLVRRVYKLLAKEFVEKI